LKTNLVARLLVLVPLLSLPPSAPAQFNSWTSPASGNWHDASWSLGLPARSHDFIMLTNAGWKAVAINRATALNHPSTLDIANLVVGSPADSFNTLMLNFSGREWPLRVANGFHLRWSSAFLIFDSGLRVGGEFHIDGTVSHSDFSEVSAGSMEVGSIFHGPGGEYNFTNGTLTVSHRLFVGPGSYSFATLRQYGGSNRVPELRVGSGEYHLHAGSVAADTLKLGSGGSYFYQHGGDVSVTNVAVIGENDGTILSVNNIWGRYTLSNGTLRTARLRVGTPNDPAGTVRGGEGDFIQYGGTNLTTALHLGAGGSNNTFRVNYSLGDGLLHTSATTIGPGYDVSFSQSGGLHLVEGPLHVDGNFVSDNVRSSSTHYGLWRGTLRSHSLTLSRATFFHIDGLNDVAGDLLLTAGAHFLQKPEYILLAGHLVTANTRVRSDEPWGFRHNGGTHQVITLLDLSGPAGSGNGFLIYEFNGGLLAAPSIRISEGIFGHVGGSVSNPGTITLAGGEWQDLTRGITELGVLRLEGASKESSIATFGNPFTLRFLPSAGATWSPNAKLIVRFWSGSTNGGGEHQIIFGNSNAGLSAQQVRQIRFRDPAGFLSGDYPARILPTGEIVPEPPPSLAVVRNGGSRMLQWPPGYILQTATNIHGPFIDITPSGPYSINPGGNLRRYFRLRR
jgi:hypothetical protein